MKRKTLTVDGVEILFRLPTRLDLLRLRAEAGELTADYEEDLSALDDGARARLAANDLELIDRALIRLALRPKLLEDAPVDPPDGTHSVLELDSDAKVEAFVELKEAANLGGKIEKDEMEAVDELGKFPTSSGPATQSVRATG